MNNYKIFMDRDNGKLGVKNTFTGEIIFEPKYRSAIMIGDENCGCFAAAVDDELTPHFADIRGKAISSTSDCIFTIDNFLVSPFADKAVELPEGCDVQYAGKIAYVWDLNKYEIWRLDTDRRIFVHCGSFDLVTKHEKHIECKNHSNLGTVTLVCGSGVYEDLPRYQYGRLINERFVKATKDRKTGIYDITANKWLTDPVLSCDFKYKNFTNAYNETIIFDLNHLCYFVDGEMRIELFAPGEVGTVYETLNRNIVALYHRGKYHIFDILHHKCVGPFDDFEDCNNVCMVYKNAKVGLLDSKLNEIYPIEYDEIITHEDDKTPWSRQRVNLIKNDKYGLGLINGKVITPCIWDIAYVGEGSTPNYIGIKNGKYVGAIAPDGRVTIEPKWEKIAGGILPNIMITSRTDDDGKTIFGIHDFIKGEVLLEEHFDNVRKKIDSSIPFVITELEGKQGLLDVRTMKYVCEPQICAIEIKDDEAIVTSLEGVTRIPLS